MTTPREPVNLAAKLASFDETWSPKIVGALNGQHVKLAKCHGEYVWHHHDDEDELFLVVRGRLRILLRDREIALDPGELFIVPRGVEHKPVADEPAEVLLFEPAATRSTGNADDARTIEAADLEWI
ncbi:MAG: cupin domain-containing protein [Planctomycetota bacterium]|jgi:mannose-6-phosphate isomerase-like protein (cupin superfamily)